MSSDVMTSLNSIQIIGNLTSDPELSYTPAGDAVVNFTIASTDRVFDKTVNEWKDADALFLRASAWREFAEHIAASLRKGTRVTANGRLKQRSYETKEGEKRTSLELLLDSIGPDLRYATATVTRASSKDEPAHDAEPWGTWPVAPLGQEGQER